MRDLHLFRQLRDDSLDHTSADSLVQLAGMNLVDRAPFFAVLESALIHPDIAIRAAAVSVLADATGKPARLAVLRALKDPAREVRDAALDLVDKQPLEALRGFAFFHRDAKVRAEALRRWPSSRFALHLTSDPVNGADVPEDVFLSPDAPQLVLALGRRGALSAERVTRYFATHEDSLRRALRYGRRRSLTNTSAIRAFANTEAARELSSLRQTCEAEDRDVLDELLALSFAATEASRGQLLRRLDRPTGDASDPLRLEVSMLHVIAKHAADPDRSVPADAIRWLVRAVPNALTFAFLDEEDRREAAGSLSDTSCGAAKVHAALLSHAMMTQAGELDLRVVIFVLLIHRGATPLELATTTLGRDRFFDAVAAHPAASARLFEGLNQSQRDKLMGELSRRVPGGGLAIRAAQVFYAAPQELPRVLPIRPSKLKPFVRHFFEALARNELRGELRITTFASLLAERATSEVFEIFVCEWLALPRPEENEALQRIFGEFGRALSTTQFTVALMRVPDELLTTALRCVDYCSTLPYGKERALAPLLLDHAIPEVRAWAVERSPAPAPVLTVRASGVAVLAESQRVAIARAIDKTIAVAIEPALCASASGVCDAWSRRSLPLGRDGLLLIGTALIACADEPAVVCLALDPILQELTEQERFQLDELVTQRFAYQTELSLIGHSWLFRYEKHAFAVVRELEGTGDLANALEATTALSSLRVSREVVRAFAQGLRLYRYRDKVRYRALMSASILDVCLKELRGPLGPWLARILEDAFLAQTCANWFGKHTPQVVRLFPDLSVETRENLRRYVHEDGVRAPVIVHLRKRDVDPERIAEIRHERSVDALRGHCASDNATIVFEAVTRLVELGEEDTLVWIADQELCARELIADSVGLWRRTEVAIAAARGEGEFGKLSDAVRYAFSRALLADQLAGESTSEVAEVAISLAADSSDTTLRFRFEDYALLAGLAPRVAERLVCSSRSHAYTEAVRDVLARSALDEAGRGALRAFLEVSAVRLRVLRQNAAVTLLLAGDPVGLPILLGDVLATTDPMLREVLETRGAIALLTKMVLMLGRSGEKAFLSATRGFNNDALEDGLRKVLLVSVDDGVRAELLSRLTASPQRSVMLRRLAELYAWGTEEGMRLTGRRFSVHMTSDGLGYTRLRENAVYVSPLPLFESAERAPEIIEGLLLHEIGHHLFHRDNGGLDVWTEAAKEGLHPLLNLVADEHLERNLRAHRGDFGDRLKALGGYAFQRRGRELPFTGLVEDLGAFAFQVLTALPLKPGRRVQDVHVKSGKLLHTMERSGLSFVRFFRALRMGLGNRHDDPRVAEGLALFDSNFKHLAMPELLSIAKRLREIFGAECQLALGAGLEDIGDQERSAIAGEGISDDEVQREVRRVLDPSAEVAESPAGGDGGELWINVNPKVDFKLIHNITRVSATRAEHEVVRREVIRPAARMRRFLSGLGLHYVTRRRRLRGFRFDRARALAMVTRGDPRVLMARERRVTTDLFVGVLVDCSGSMVGDSITLARRFAVLLAEAARGLPGVDVRVFGFTDKKIFDAGDAFVCGAAALQAGGGNNDAAALYHGAVVARKSARSAKLLVMISDGLPTECSVASLRDLVERLTKEGMCCAQIAVRPLEEVCFPHYVEVREASIEESVRRFGEVVMKLVRTAVARG